jgi:ATP-dependent DNA helicase DinG
MSSIDALVDRLTGAMGARGERREGQHEMARAVSRAIETRRHLVVQAGTGTGKSLAYLVPAVTQARRTVVVTATKALQDQLADAELPFLREHLGRTFRFAVLKGRSNYLCLQRLDELMEDTDRRLGIEGSTLDAERLAELDRWAAETPTGDRAEAPSELGDRAWAAVSVGPRECPGANRCPRGEECFAEAARRRAASAEVVVVNAHLYGLHLATGGVVLPPHDVVVVDEAHELPGVISATTGRELGGGRFVAVARLAGSLVAEPDLVRRLEEIGPRLHDFLADLAGTRLRQGVPDNVARCLTEGRDHLTRVLDALRSVPTERPDVATRVARLQTSIGALVEDLDAMLSPPLDSVLWVDGSAEHPRLALAPLDVGRVLTSLLWDPPVGFGEDDGDRPGPASVILASATIPPGLAEELGMPPGSFDTVDVGTPFDFERQALLYCPTHLPDPRSAAYPEAMHRELVKLIETAGGRTLALFTSHRAMRDAAEAVASRVEHRILVLGDLPKARLVAEFTHDTSSCLFATLGFWQGIDVPGPSLSLVTIDRIPFPRPDDPLLSARREAAGPDAFRKIDLPRAATLLAQGAGRLIRHRDDRGVVAVLDRRLATQASYRWDLIAALPPMRRTKDPAAVAAMFDRSDQA